jgi:hypothetical protein
MIKDLVFHFVATKIGANLLFRTLVAPPESAHTGLIDRPKQIASVKAFRILLVRLYVPRAAARSIDRNVNATVPPKT